MDPLVVTSTRGAHVECEHALSVAVVDREGRLVASSGDPQRATWWRSAAKPMQVRAALHAGVWQRFGWLDDALALACASHSSEPAHRALAAQMLSSCGCSEHDLACGAHPPLSTTVHDDALRTGSTPTPLWSNCSGKHAAMLAFARHLDVDVRGYERADHPVQRAILHEVARATDLPVDAIGCAGDGCRAVTFHLPLQAMATAWARLGSDDDDASVAIRRAMTTHPHLVAGTGRACTRLLQGGRGALVVKVGAEGVYCAAVPHLGVGIALKVHGGDARAAAVALCATLLQLDADGTLAHESWQDLASPGVVDTRGDVVGRVSARGALRVH